MRVNIKVTCPECHGTGICEEVVCENVWGMGGFREIRRKEKSKCKFCEGKGSLPYDVYEDYQKIRREMMELEDLKRRCRVIEEELRNLRR